MPIEHSYAVASFLFRTVAPDAVGDFPWGRAFLQEVFVDHPDSMRNYWRRASLGLLDLDFTILTSAAWTFDEFSQPGAQGQGGRNRTAAAARQFCADNDISLAGYDHLVVVVPPMPIDWGATGEPPIDVVYEQIDNTMAAMQHEIGHSLGFMHAFGPFIPPPNPYGSVYNDPYCVMGYTGTQSRPATPPIDAGLAARPKNGTAFWLSERRPSAAALWRHLAEFKLSPQWVSYVEGVGPTTVRIFGLCSVGSQRVTVIAVIPRRGHPNQFVTVEYRPAVGDDTGVSPAVVVHTIGVNPVGAGHGEIDPPWFEGAIPVAVGASLTLFDYRIRISAIAAGPPESVEVDIQFIHFPLPA